MMHNTHRRGQQSVRALHLLLCISLTLSILALPVSKASAQAGDLIIYGANGYDINTIVEINLTQNSSRVVGNLLFGTQAIEQDPVTGVVYYYEWQKTADEFAYWDPATGTSTEITVYIPSPKIYAKRMAFHPDGTLYLMDNNDRLYTINPQTGALTLLGKINGLENGTLGATGDMAFAPDGTLYVATYQSLYSVNIPSRSATLLYSGMIGGSGVVVWSGLAYCNGMLYGSSLEESVGGRNIYRINPQTGQTKFLFASAAILNDLTSCAATSTPPANLPPQAVNDAYNTTAGVPLQVNAPGVLGNDSDPDNDGLTAVLATPPANGDLSFQANGAFTYTPNPGFSGVDSFTYYASDGKLGSQLATVTITVAPPAPVNQPPQAVNDAYSTTAGVPLQVNAPGVLGNDSDPDNDGLTAVLVSGPANGQLNLSANGAFTYSPNPGFSGVDSFTYQAFDGELSSNTATVTITVAPPAPVNQPPQAVNDAYQTDAGAPLNVSAPGVLGNDSDPDNDGLTAVLVSGPANGQLNLSASGAFTYTPNPGFSGVDSFTYQAFDGELSSNTATVTITVNPIAPPDQPPGDLIIYGANGYDINTIVEINLTQNSSRVVGNLLFGTQAIEQDPVTGVVYYYEWQKTADEFAYWDPATGTSTEITVYIPSPKIYAKRMAFHPDGTLYLMDNNDRLYTINPQTGALTLLGKINGLENGTLGATGDMAFAPDGTLYVATYQSLYSVNIPSRSATLLYSGMIGGSGVVVWSGLAYCNGMLYGSSLEESVGGSNIYRINPQTGQTEFLFASAAILNDLTSCAATSTPPANQPPQAVNDAYQTDAGAPLNVSAPGVLGNDSDPDNDGLTAVLVSGPANGQLNLSASGAFTYTPNPGFSGVDSFTYQAFDGELSSNTATVTITVNPPQPTNQPPQAVNDAYQTDAGVPLNVSTPGVLGNDSDPDNDGLTAVLVSGPANGQLNLSANGAFTYTPNPGFSGVDSFTYQAFDGELSSNTATVTITVNPPQPTNQPPQAVNDAYQTDAGVPLNVSTPGVLGNDSDPDNDGLTAVLVSGPANGQLNLSASGAFTYTPNPGFSGIDSFTYQAFDGELSSNTATVTITVAPPAPVNQPPQAVNDAYQTDADTPLNVSAPGVLGNDSDPDNDGLSAVLISGPANGQLNLSTSGAFTYTPNPGFSGVDSFTYQAFDGELSSNTATVTITVNPIAPPNQPPVAAADAYSTSAGVPLVVAAPGVLDNDSDPDGDDLVAVLVTPPASGDLSFQADGGFTYTPNPGFSGIDSFTYRAWDGELASPPVTVTITVTPVSTPGDLIVFGANAYNLNEIYAINLTQQTSSLVGELAFGSLAIDVDPQSGYMYYFEWQRSATRFGYWDPVTGTHTLVRVYNPSPKVNFSRMAFHPNGTLFMMDDRDRLYLIDKVTGDITLLGATSGMASGEFRGTGDMAFAPDGTLYVATNQHLYTLDVITRQVTLIAADMLSGHEVDIWSGLAFCNGMLYGADIHHVAGVDYSNLYRIDPITGATEFLFMNPNYVNDLTGCVSNYPF